MNKTKIERRIKLLEHFITGLIMSLVAIIGGMAGFKLDWYDYLIINIIAVIEAIVLWLHLDGDRE